MNNFVPLPADEQIVITWPTPNRQLFTAPEKFGFTPDGYQIVIELKDGKKLAVDFSTELPSQAGLAAVTLDGERWAFVCPASLYQFAKLYLVIPPNTP